MDINVVWVYNEYFSDGCFAATMSDCNIQIMLIMRADIGRFYCIVVAISNLKFVEDWHLYRCQTVSITLLTNAKCVIVLVALNATDLLHQI